MRAEGVELTPDQEDILDEVEAMVISAIGAQCEGCSTAKFAPMRIGKATAKEDISRDTADRIAATFQTCQGLGRIGTAPLCRFPKP
jgi:hypothetical protein